MRFLCTWFALFAASSTGNLAQSWPYVTIPRPPTAYTVNTLDAATADDVLHVAWAQSTAFWPPTGHYSRSADHGRSWLTTPITLPAGNIGSIWSLAASGQIVCFFHPDPIAPLVCSSSVDGGLSWRAPAPLLPADATSGSFAVNGATVHALLFASATGTVSYQRSADAGLTWCANPIALGNASATAQLAVTGNVLHAAWPDAAGLHYTRSIDGGVTWQPSQPLAPPILNAQFVLMANGTTVVLAYNQNLAISVIRSIDAGASWQSPRGLAIGYGLAGAMDGNGVCLAWRQVGPPPPATFSTAWSNDAGLTWQGAPLPPVNTYYGLAASVRSIRYHNGTISIALEYIDWFMNVWMAYPGTVFVSKDQGTTWLQSQVEALMVRGVLDPVLLPLSDSMALVWRSASAASYALANELRASLLFGYQPYGTDKCGTGNLAPQLHGNGEPHTGSSVVIAMCNACGGSPALVAASFNGPASLPFGSGLLLVQPPTVNFVGMTSGTQGAPGAGAFGFPIAIPFGAAFRNQRLDLQGCVLDPAAADGFAATAGLEVWTF